MTVEKVKQLLQRGENIDIEFKTSQFDINKDVFDSICGFLNRMGGHLLLGVNDKGKVEGVVEACIPAMINNLVTSANNPGKLNPPILFVSRSPGLRREKGHLLLCSRELASAQYQWKNI